MKNNSYHFVKHSLSGLSPKNSCCVNNKRAQLISFVGGGSGLNKVALTYNTGKLRTGLGVAQRGPLPGEGRQHSQENKDEAGGHLWPPWQARCRLSITVAGTGFIHTVFCFRLRQQTQCILNDFGMNLVISKSSNNCQDFPGGSDGKVSAYNVGDPGSIPGLGRSSGEGNGNPLQWFCLENPMDGGAWWATVHGVAKGGTRLSN